MESSHDVEQQQQPQEEAEGGEGRRDGLWDVLDSLTHQPTVTIKMEPGIGVSVCNSNCPKELTYLGQHPTFTRPFVPSIIPSPSLFPSHSSPKCTCCSPSICHCKQQRCVIMVLGASEHLLLACPCACRRVCVCVCVCACTCLCVTPA